MDRLKIGIAKMTAIPRFARALIGPQLEKSCGVIEDINRSTMAGGFRRIFVTTAIIAICGVILTLLLRENPGQMEA